MTDNNSHSIKRWRRQAIKQFLLSLNIKSQKELADLCGIAPANICRILNGETLPGNKLGPKLCKGIRTKAEGLSYSETVDRVTNGLNCLWRKLAEIEGKKIYKVISEETVDLWKSMYKEELLYSTNWFSNDLGIGEFIDCNGTSIGLEPWLRLFENYGIKFDFNRLSIDKRIIEPRLPAYASALESGVQNNEYDLVKRNFAVSRYILCIFSYHQLVEDISKWLIGQSVEHCDWNTFFMASSSLTWFHTLSRRHSNNYLSSLRQARALQNLAWNRLNDVDSLKDIDIDVIAILSELNLRVPLRLYRVSEDEFSLADFDKLFTESEGMLLQGFEFNQSLDRRMKERFLMALHYQKALYYYLLGRYSYSERLFQGILQKAGLMGWDRLIAATNSWLAKIACCQGDNRSCLSILDEMSGDAGPSEQDTLTKRDAISYLIRAEVFEHLSQDYEARRLREIVARNYSFVRLW